MPSIPGRLAFLSIVDADGVEHRLDSPIALEHPQCRCDPGPVDEMTFTMEADVADLGLDDFLDLHFGYAVGTRVEFDYRPRGFWPDEMQARRRVRRRERKAAKVRP